MRYLMSILVASLTIFSAAACTSQAPAAESPEASQAVTPPPGGYATAVFAGGCFWCMEGPFEALEGVAEVVSGYTGGPEQSPTYQQVSAGQTGHLEAVRVEYDPAVVTYEQLLDVFWRSMDPTDAGGQFADRGSQYGPAIFVSNDAERAAAERSKAALEADGPFAAPIVVPIVDAGAFWDAEDYHQDYYITNESHYRAYRRGSGRERFLREHWGDAAH